MGFGVKLIEQRKKYGFSQEQLADRLGVSRQAISRWEAENTLPDAYNLKKLSELFHVSIDYLLSDEGCPPGGQENAFEKAQGTQGTREAPPRRWRTALPLALTALGLLGILTFYVLSTQIPAVEMRPDRTISSPVQIDSNTAANVPEKVFYTAREVYAFFPFLDTYHLEGLAAGFACLAASGALMLLYRNRERLRAVFSRGR